MEDTQPLVIVFFSQRTKFTDIIGLNTKRKKKMYILIKIKSMHIVSVASVILILKNRSQDADPGNSKVQLDRVFVFMIVFVCTVFGMKSFTKKKWFLSQRFIPIAFRNNQLKNEKR